MPAAIGYDFADPDLLQLALSHRSWCAENGQVASNERLEFLGDAVLGLAVADEIFLHHPDLPEGQLAKLRAGVVNSATLAEIARSIGLGSALLLGKGEAATGGADKQSILADALEAIIGAVYIDGGFDEARALVLRLWQPVIADAVREGPGGFDHKTRLQEIAVAEFERAPDYQVDTAGPDHARVFTARVVIGTEILGAGTGSSKKEAEQAAARQAVLALNHSPATSDDPVDDADADSERRAS